MDPNSIWDRGKVSNDDQRTTPEDVTCLRRLRDSMNNIESYLGTASHRETSMTSQNSQSFKLVCPSPPHDDTLSDVDLDKFDPEKLPNEDIRISINSAMLDNAETASLSNFHNVRDILLNIRQRLDSYLKTCQESATNHSSNLESNIAALKRELEGYVQVINEKKEKELRKFSENMINQSNIMQMRKAFLRKEKLKSNIYETLRSHNYAIADDESLPSLNQDRVHIKGGFTMKNCYDNDYAFESYSDFSSVEYYEMLINEDRCERLLNDAPLPRYQERERISLIFRDPQDVIKEWQNYQLKTIKVKPKKEKIFNVKWTKSLKLKHRDFWGFTLDSNQNRVLQLKLKKERRMRYVKCWKL